MFDIKIIEDILDHFPIRHNKITLIQDLVNTTYKIDSGKEAYKLKIYKKQSVDAIKNELVWVSALSAQTSIITAKPVLSVDGEYVKLFCVNGVQYPAALTSWTDGNILPQSSRSAEHYKALGGLAAQMHSHSKTWIPPADFHRPDISSKSIAEMKGWDHLRGDKKNLAEICVDEINAVERELSNVNGYGLIHADLSFGNILFQGFTPVPIDFSDCGYGFFLYDIAVILAGAFLRNDYYACCTEFFAGYGIDGSKIKNHVETLMLQRALSLILWAEEESEGNESLIHEQWDRINKLRGF
jgi:Ser/Thr protein kinase RdoA (MazF antagonist)